MLATVTVVRTDPPFLSPERPALREWLDFHRATLELKCEGLDRAGLIAQPIASSLLSLQGLVRHMAEVERNWFRRVLAGEDAPPLYYDDDEHPDGDFELLADADWTADLATWRDRVRSAPGPSRPRPSRSTRRASAGASP